jgi:DNA helicase-2/ATP-dependent DNA helicase PcrA
MDLPPTASEPPVRAATALDRIDAIGIPAPTSPSVTQRPIDEPLTLSFSGIDDYLTCPLKFKLGHVVRVPVPPHHAMVYGAAIHRAVQEFHRRHARGDVMSEAELDAAFEAAWSNEGFLSREHEEARLAAGRQTLRRFRAAQLVPGATIPAWVEREFTFSLGGDRIRGRWDRVDIEPAPVEASPAAPEAAASEPHADTVAPTLELTGRERVTITDYKTSDVREPAKARQRARESLQLQIYAMAYEAVTGRLPDAVQLHFLDTGVTGRAEVDQRRLARGRERIAVAAAGIRARDYTPRPDRTSCGYCAFRAICPSSVAT